MALGTRDLTTRQSILNGEAMAAGNVLAALLCLSKRAGHGQVIWMAMKGRSREEKKRRPRGSGHLQKRHRLCRPLVEKPLDPSHVLFAIEIWSSALRAMRVRLARLGALCGEVESLPLAGSIRRRARRLRR
jgi:hypothetical protein